VGIGSDGILQCDHLSGKPGNVRDFTKSQGSVSKKSCQRKVAKSCLLLVAYLHPYKFSSIQLVLCVNLCFYHYEVFVSYFNH